MVLSLPQYWAQLEQQHGLPSGYLARTRQIESSGDPFARSPTGALGPFQFTKGTAGRMNLALEDRTDEYKSADAAARLAAANKAQMESSLGRPVTRGAELYLAHQQGAAGATGLLKNWNSPAGQAVGSASNIAVNSGDPNQSAGAFAQKFINKFENAQNAAPAGVDASGSGGLLAQTATPNAFTPAAAGTTQTPIRQGGGLLGLMSGGSDPTQSMAQKLSGFMASPEASGAAKGAGMLAQALAAPGPAAPPPQQLTVEENKPDMSLLAMIQKKRKGVGTPLMSAMGGMG